MEITNQNGTVKAKNPEEIWALLNRRNEFSGIQANSFWIAHEGSKCPVIGLWVAGDLATMDYMPDDQCAGFVSCGNVPGLDENGKTLFYFEGQRQFIPNRRVIKFSEAYQAVVEFFHYKSLPKSVEWLAL